MIYLHIDNNRIKALCLNKSLMGQYDYYFFEKSFHIDFFEKDSIASTDLLASAIKEVVTNLLPEKVKDKNIVLILNQSNFKFLRTEVPVSITPKTISAFITDKIRTEVTEDVNKYFSDYFLVQQDLSKEINIFLFDKERYMQIAESFKLLDLKIQKVLPDTLSYFKLFEKTLHREKKENILFGHYDKDYFFAYYFDSLGLTPNKQIVFDFKSNDNIETFLKQKGDDWEKNNQKINRLILSGEESENIRQDTFTKNTGMWTNPLKKITANFYQDYLKIISSSNKNPLPILIYDVCFGAFILSLENKNFNLMKPQRFSLPTMPKENNFTSVFFKKELLIFAVSFIASGLMFFGLMKLNIKFTLPQIFEQKNVLPSPSPVPTKTATPTPTPKINKETIKIKILNGGGVSGKALEVKRILQKLGYQEIVTGNADNFDYTETVIQFNKLNEMSASAKELKNELNDYTTTVKLEEINDKELPDITLIIGQDFK